MYNHYFYTIRSAFWGYRKCQTDEYISEIIRSNRKRLAELSRRIDDLEEEKRQLEMVSFDLKRDIPRFSAENIPVDMFVEVFQTIDGIEKTLPAQSIDPKNFEETELIKTIHGVEESVKQELGILSGKVDALAGMLEDLNSVQQTRSAEMPRNVAEMKENPKQKEIGRNDEPVMNKKPEQAAPAVNMGKVLSFSRVNTALAQNTVKKEVPQKQVSAFWGNAVNGYTSDIVSLGIDTQEVLDYVNRTVDTVPFNSFFDSRIPVNKGIKSSEIAAVLESKKNTFPVLEQPGKVVEERQNEGYQQVEIDEDARYIRQKYIVGKIAGQDLFDRSGKLIIGRSCKITSQAVDYADREGKLPELIINMILPDLE